MSDINKYSILEEEDQDKKSKQGSRFENKFDNYEYAWTRQDIMNSRNNDNG